MQEDKESISQENNNINVVMGDVEAQTNVNSLTVQPTT